MIFSEAKEKTFMINNHGEFPFKFNIFDYNDDAYRLKLENEAKEELDR